MQVIVMHGSHKTLTMTLTVSAFFLQSLILQEQAEVM